MPSFSFNVAEVVISFPLRCRSVSCSSSISASMSVLASCFPILPDGGSSVGIGDSVDVGLSVVVGDLESFSLPHQSYPNRELNSSKKSVAKLSSLSTVFLTGTALHSVTKRARVKSL